MLSQSIFILAACLLVRSEPPVNSYLPPNGNGGPSISYGTPSNGNGNGHSNNNGNGNGHITGNGNGRTYFSPQEAHGSPGILNTDKDMVPGSSYLPPGNGNGNGPQINGVHKPPSTSYGAPSVNGNGNGQSNGNGLRNGNGNGKPISVYGVPKHGHGNGNGNNGNGNGPSNGNANGKGKLKGANGSPPKGTYGVPNGNGNGIGNGYTISNGDDGNNEPVKYEFEYQVTDDEAGLDFGHKEQRDGDLATGEYNVLLPDGRKQIVTYEADDNGYRPKIRYEDVGNKIDNDNGYGNGGSNGNGNGYPNSRTNGNGNGHAPSDLYGPPTSANGNRNGYH